jgi:hypothetical protein
MTVTNVVTALMYVVEIWLMFPGMVDAATLREAASDVQ